MMAIVAGPWFVLETTGSAARTRIVSAALAIGGILPTFPGGPLVQKAGADSTIVGMGAIYLLVPLGIFFSRSLLQMDASTQS